MSKRKIITSFTVKQVDRMRSVADELSEALRMIQFDRGGIVKNVIETKIDDCQPGYNDQGFIILYELYEDKYEEITYAAWSQLTPEQKEAKEYYIVDFQSPKDQPDWDQTDSAALDFIGNKPAIPADLTVPPTDEPEICSLGRVHKLEFQFDGRYIWTDGDNIYYSQGIYHYVLDKTGLLWISKMWNGLTEFYGAHIWTDGDNIYYSAGSDQYVLDKEMSTWAAKVWIDEKQTNISLFGGDYIWSDGTNTYYSFDSDQYVLDKDTSTWHKKTWNGLRKFYGRYVWTDGSNIYYSNGRIQCILNKETSTWTINPWNNALRPSDKFIFRDADYIWSDDNKIYYSAGVEQYVLDKVTWYPKMWNGITLFRGDHVWTDGGNIYYSYDSDQYVLDKATSTWIEKTWKELKLFSE